MTAVTDKHFREWEQATFGYGYGTGEAYILPALQTFLAAIADNGSYTAAQIEIKLNATITWLLINVLCRANILEYGISPRYGTLTYKGEQLRAYVLGHTAEELYAIATQDFDPEHPLCSPAFCNCPGAVEDQGCHNNPLFDPLTGLSGHTWWRAD